MHTPHLGNCFLIHNLISSIPRCHSPTTVRRLVTLITVTEAMRSATTYRHHQ
jgi:hypothetical protein